MEESSKRATSTPDANKQRSRSYLSFMSTQEKLELRSWGLPDSILKQYQQVSKMTGQSELEKGVFLTWNIIATKVPLLYFQMGIVTMFEWQAECLANERVLGGNNLVRDCKKFSESCNFFYYD